MTTDYQAARESAVMFELNELRFVGYRLDRFYP